MRIAIALLLCACSSPSDSNPDASSLCSFEPDSCAPGNICIPSTRTCAPALPRTYRISNIAHSVPTTKPDSTPWDTGPSPPDLYVIVSVNTAPVATTSVVNDQYSAQIPGAYDVQLPASPTLQLASFDEDISADDAVYTCSAAPVTPDHLRSRGLQCAMAGYSLTLKIEALP